MSIMMIVVWIRSGAVDSKSTLKPNIDKTHESPIVLYVCNVYMEYSPRSIHITLSGVTNTLLIIYHVKLLQ